LQNLNEDTNKLLAIWFIENITKKLLNNEIIYLKQKYINLYKKDLYQSENIEEYWENEFYWWKIEAYEDVLELLKKYRKWQKEDYYLKKYKEKLFPAVSIIRLYEDWTLVLTYSKNWDKEYIDKLYKKLQKESEDKNFDRYEVYIKWDWIEEESE
jgi:hypothetical protein